MYDMSTVKRWVRHVGLRPVAEVSAGWLATRAVRSGMNRYSKPALDDYLGLAGHFAMGADEMLRDVGLNGGTFEEEFGGVSGQLERRYRSTEVAFPDYFGVEEETGRMLYATVRLTKPRIVVETGVADGRSSFILLEALRRNGHGELHSFDVDPRAGSLVEDHANWHLTISPADEPEMSFKAQLATLPAPIDLFFHDADHRYLSQLFEYETAWPLMASGGLFASDDIDDSRAFIHFCEARGLTPTIMFDRRKLIGAVRVD